MPYRQGKSRLPEILRSKGLEPIDVYTRPTVLMSRQQFSDYYTGRKKMSAPTLRMFSEELNVPMNDLAEWIYYPPRKRNRRPSTE